MPHIELKDAINRSFDYVIIGGGTAGLVLATRLTESADTSVLILEAGEENLDDPLITKIGLYGQTFGQEKYDWCSMTVPQVNADNTVFPWPRGRILGGSSAVNFTAWNKPSKEDIDAWEKLGNEGWNWETLDKYISRATTYTPPTLSEAEHARRGTPRVFKELWAKGPVGNGPIQISYPPYRTDLDVKIQQAIQGLGYPVAPAPLDGNPNGVTIGAMSVDPETVERSFTGNAYWKPNSARPNLSLLTGAVVHRLVTTETDGELVVTGVEFFYKSGGGEAYTARASKEVILSAGTLRTPQVLELSGIGSPEVLQKVGIPVKLALNGVGENVQDHIHSTVVVELKDDVQDETYDVLRNPGEAEKNMALFTKAQGLYTMGINTFLYAPLPALSDKGQEIISSARKEIEAGIAAGKYPAGLADQYKIVLENIEKVPTCEIIVFPGAFGGKNMPAPGKKYYAFVAALNGLFSRGTIHVTTTDPAVPSAIDPHYFEQDIDLKTHREVMKFCRKLAGVAELKEYFGESPQELNPGPSVSTDKDLEDYVKRFSSTTFHPIGSASMLPREKGGVVDNKLRVYGTKNLRVVDLSIVPLHFGSHTQCIAYGVGEYAADIIKGLA
ncbi:hypothetical protein D9756_000984 [Leucocoprinus leucothites]|uniref:pyranose dehydrogenase (acceptor) n=1 Tax=Leucocoprinus leucothites TaxID=201217 RepID=A0A8H5GEP8_9AGAR|nr:hypothetical protein D9756_000984 [Leucoagaricus leucothites]